MSRMLRSDWVSRIGHKTKKADQRRQRRLGCEPLEDRRVLAVVMNAADAGPGSLRDAVASGDASVTFDPSVTSITLTSGEIAGSASVTIDGGAGVTVTAAPGARIFNFTADATLKSLTLTGGDVTGAGGAVYTDSNLTLDGTTVTGNSAGTDGGGLRVAGASLTLINSTLENNFAYDDGGAFAMNDGDLTMQGSTIDSNKAGETVANGGMLDNGSAQGGGFYIFDGVDGVMEILIEDSTISNNSVIAESGPLGSFAGGGGMSIRDLNIAPSGGVAGDQSNVTIRRSTIENNSNFTPDADPSDTIAPDARGGGAYLSLLSNVTIEDSTFTGNYSYDNGSGMAVTSYQNYMNFTMTGSTVSGNGDGATVGLTGTGGAAGGMWLIPFGPGAGYPVFPNGLNATISDSDISDNVSAFGGNMLIQQGGLVDISDSTITGGTATRGGGIYALDFAGSFPIIVNLDSVDISGNTASISGGGIDLNGNGYSIEMNVNNSSITGNSADQSFGADPGTVPDDDYAGGGINVREAQLTVYQSTISGNSVVGFGGGIRTQSAIGSGTYLNRATVTDNDATGVGAYASYNAGGVYGYNGTSTSFNSSIVSGNTQNGGVDVSDVYQGYTSGTMSETNSLIGSDENGLPGGSGPIPGLAGGALVGTSAAPVSADIGALTALQNGTFGHVPNVGGNSFNNGDPAIVGGTDQGGLTRVNDGQADVGAVESNNVINPPVTGDFNNDGLFDCVDLTELSNEIAAGTNNPAYDMNGDGVVTNADITDGEGTGVGLGWLSAGGAANGFTTTGFQRADANLSGGVDGQDFLVWNTFKFTANADGICVGDFNLDGNVDGQDFLVWNGQKFTSASDTISSNSTRINKGGASLTARAMGRFTEEDIVRPTETVRTPIAAPAAVVVTASEAGTSELKSQSTRTQLAATPVLSQRVVESINSVSNHDDSEESAIDSVFANLGSDL